MSLFRLFSLSSLLTLSLALSFSSISFSAEEDEGDEIEEIIVTGSRIARADIDGANPIIEITAEDIRATGEMSLAEVLRQSNVNSFGSFQPRSGSTAQSQATISLRGAGSGRTLVLLDGKRMAGSPSYGGVAANINSIPFSAVERVEILTDGGSALYGSDALAGVVNVIMKKDFEGAEAFVFKGDPKREGGEQEAYGFTAGLSSDLGNVVISFEHDEREIVYMADRWWSQRNFVDGKDVSNATSYFDTLNASFYSCNMWSYASPGFGYEAIPACVGQGDFLGGGNVYDYGGGGVVLYPYNQIMAEDASSGRDTLFVNYNYDINDNHQINARGMVTKVNGFGRYAPVAGWFGVKCSKWGGCPYTEAQLKAGAGWTSTDVQGPGAAGYDDVDIYYRMRSVGPRLGQNTDYFTDYLLDFTGDLGFANYSVFLHHSRADYGHMGYNYTLKSVASKLAEDGTFEFANMSAKQAGQLRYTEVSEDDMALRHAGFTLIGEIDTYLPVAGPLDWVVGFEYMDTNYSVLVDAQRESGNVMGSAGSSSGGYRDIDAFFAEFRLPITDTLELNLAHRSDDYSDFGSANNSKFSVKWQALDNLILRASFSESFIAPTLDSLGMSTSFSADSGIDRVMYANAGVPEGPLRRSQQQRTWRLANPDLGPETGEYLNLGVVWNITDDLSLVFDVYELTLENQEILITVSDLFLAEWAGLLGNITSVNPLARLDRNPYVPGSSAVDDGSGMCQYGGAARVPCIGSLKDAYAPMANAGGFEISGIDLSLDYTYETANFGTFRPMLDLTMVNEYLTEEFIGGPMADFAGRNGLPEMRGIFTVAWSKGDFDVYWQMEYIDSMYEASNFDVPTLSSSASGNLDSHTLQNIQISWTAPSDTTITLGVKNLEDEDPVIDSSYEWNMFLYDIYGRTTTFMVEHRF